MLTVPGLGGSERPGPDRALSEVSPKRPEEPRAQPGSSAGLRDPAAVRGARPCLRASPGRGRWWAGPAQAPASRGAG